MRNKAFEAYSDVLLLPCNSNVKTQDDLRILVSKEPLHDLMARYEEESKNRTQALGSNQPTPTDELKAKLFALRMQIGSL